MAIAAWLAGLTSVADWIGSNQAWFPLGERFDNLDVFYQNAQILAQQALDKIGWRMWQPLLTTPMNDSDRLVAYILADETKLARPLQSMGDQLLKQAQEPMLMVVEAPMAHLSIC
ncbi:hypothetical protein D5085_15970 [Ectothiorhodospiraceae bacterium BW-2]|nr:hypothetical protein D5085_15970 [Ectothiorhodospiraceae bacterium BW-2]